MSDKSATERLREMLDERGVEWESKDVEGIPGFHDTRWNAYDVRWCYVEFVGNNYTKLGPSGEFHCTPEQAIAATLGSGTCEMETDDSELELIASSHEDTWAYKCSACDWSFRYDRGIKPNYCPNCGTKVVGE